MRAPPSARAFASAAPFALAATFGLAATFALGLGCGSDFANRSEITGLRYLGIQAEPPWIVPGESTTITPLIVGQAPGSSLRYRWSWCPLRGPNEIAFECIVTVDDINAATGTTAPDLPDDFFELGDEETASLDFAFPPELVEAVCEAIRGRGEISTLISVPECDGTFPVSVRVDTSDGDKTITGFKTVTLVYDTAASRQLNANPDISGLGLWARFAKDRVSGPLAYDAEYRLELGRPEGVTPLEQLDRLSETYTRTSSRTVDGMVVSTTKQTREQLVLSWFAATGAYDNTRTGFLPDTLLSESNPDGIPIDEAWADARTNDYVTPRPTDFDPGETTLYAVIRDDRGGTSWTSTTVRIGPR